MNEKNELFQSDKDFSNLVKKARRKTWMRNIIISISVSFLLFGGLLGFGTYMMNKKAEETHKHDYLWQFVKGANVENNGSIFTSTPFSKTVTTEQYKEIAGVPIPWGQYEKVFSIFGTSREIHASIISSSEKTAGGRSAKYFQGERVIEFYHPTTVYSQLPDDRNKLDDIPEHQAVEIAFSFDQAYSITEVREKFAEQLAWYWVNADSPDEKEDGQPLSGEDAYGFTSKIEEMNEDAAERFIQQIGWLQAEGETIDEAQQLYDALTDSGKIELTPESLTITGAVVTGTAEELKRFHNDPMIRAAVLGATANKY